MQGVSFGYADETLYHEAALRLFEGEHAALVGANGSGKTTLLKLLNRELKPDIGTIAWVNHIRVGYLDQYASLPEDRLVKDYMQEAFASLFAIEREMESLYERAATEAKLDKQTRMFNRAAQLSDQLLEREFYAIKSKISDITNGLGLPLDVLDKPIGHLSGGMRAKIILGKLLLEEADVLLLDEPTNFLDVKHIDWLARFLREYPKSFIVISHHEAFLRAISTTVFAIESKQITRYKGDYDFYLEQRALRQRQHEKDFVSQQKFIKRTEEFIQKNITRAKTSKRAQSRRKMLAKLDRIAAPKRDRHYRFAFPLAAASGRDVLAVSALEIGYDEPLVEPIDMEILKEEKVVITGKNGIGKSTLIKTLVGDVDKLGGGFHWSDTVRVAYFAQEKSMPEGSTPFSLIHDTYPRFTRNQVLTLLATHGIDAEMARRPYASLSGGEQTKVRLALLRHQKANVLILDEPTNHLDKAAKEALKEALIDYRGTLVLVSHEKPFYEAVCDYEISLYTT